jgi:hypothetical protein
MPITACLVSGQSDHRATGARDPNTKAALSEYSALYGGNCWSARNWAKTYIHCNLVQRDRKLTRSRAACVIPYQLHDAAYETQRKSRDML